MPRKAKRLAYLMLGGGFAASLLPLDAPDVHLALLPLYALLLWALWRIPARDG